MNSKIKKIVCAVLAVLIIAAVVLIVFCISKANKAYHDYMFYSKYLDQSPYPEIHLNNFIMFIGIAIFALFTLLSNGFLLFIFLSRKNKGNGPGASGGSGGPIIFPRGGGGFSGGGGLRVTRIFSGRTDRSTFCPTLTEMALIVPP